MPRNSKKEKKKIFPFSRKNSTPSRRYSRFLRCLSQRDTKVVVALGSGGIRMFGHIPVMKFLEQIGATPHISEIWGVSGGAIIGLYYAMGVSPDEMKEVGLGLTKAHHRLELVPSTFSILHKLIRESLFPNLSKMDKKFELVDLLKGFHDCQADLHKIISKVVHSKPRFPFYCLAYNLKSQQNDILSSMPIPARLYPDWIQHTDPMDAIMASSSIPILFVPKVIENSHKKRVYVDGSTVEDVPCESIYKKWMLDRELGIEKRKRLLVLAVSFSPYFTSFGILENWLLKRFPGFQYFFLSAYYADLMRQARTKVQKNLLKDDPNVEFIDLNLEMPRGSLMDIHRIPQILKIAEKACPTAFGKINDSLMD
jgi:predicted acylesterase/phospholipase RssA